MFRRTSAQLSRQTLERTIFWFQDPLKTYKSKFLAKFEGNDLWVSSPPKLWQVLKKINFCTIELLQVFVSTNFSTNILTNSENDELLISKPSEDILGPRFLWTINVANFRSLALQSSDGSKFGQTLAWTSRWTLRWANFWFCSPPERTDFGFLTLWSSKRVWKDELWANYCPNSETD